MSELLGQVAMDLSVGAAPENSEWYDENGKLLPEPRQGEGLPDIKRLDVLAGEINLLEGQAREMFKATAVQIGTRLIEAQGLVPKGRWGEWLKKNIDYSTRKAQQLMQVAEAYAGKTLPESYDRLSFTQIYDLLAAPAEERDALAEQAAEEGLSTRQLKERIRALEEEKQENNCKIYDLIQQNEAMERACKAEQDKTAFAEKVAEAQKARAERAEEASEANAQTAADAMNRANATAEELRAARALIKDMENREPERVEVVPEAMTAEIEDLRRQLAEAQAATASSGGAEAQKALALALQVRIAVKDSRSKLDVACQALEGLKTLDGEKWQMLRGELLALAKDIMQRMGV